MVGGQRFGYRLVMAIDVERYSSRSAREQLLVQHDLVRVLDVAATRCGLDRARWHRQVSGDSELAVLPDDTDVAHVVGAFPERLSAALAELNGARPAGSRLRVRLAFHHGTLAPGPFGPAGDAPVVVSRLLDADQLRSTLAGRPDQDMVLVVSDTLFTEVIATGFCALAPADFDVVRVVAKGVTYRGHIHHGGRKNGVVAPASASHGRRAAGHRKRHRLAAVESRYLHNVTDPSPVPSSIYEALLGPREDAG